MTICRVLFAACFLLSLPSSSRAEPIVVPGILADIEGNLDNLFPFDSSTPISYQQVYPATEFGRQPVMITGMAFRPDSAFGQAFSHTLFDIHIFLSTTAASVDGLSRMLPSNAGPDNSLVRSGPLQLASQFTGPTTGPKDFDIQIAFSTPFLYKPTAGNLLLWVITDNIGDRALAFDAVFDDDGVSRVYNFGSGSTATHQDTIGLVTRFDATPVRANFRATPRQRLGGNRSAQVTQPSKNHGVFPSAREVMYVAFQVEHDFREQ